MKTNNIRNYVLLVLPTNILLFLEALINLTLINENEKLYFIVARCCFNGKLF